jgi:integrase
LPTVEEAIRALEPYRFCEWIFPSAQGERLWISNTRWRVWYLSLSRAGLRHRDLYQTRHTFASLMLQSGEDPAWVARMLGHATLQMLYQRYGKFIQNRNRRDGELYLKQLKN